MLTRCSNTRPLTQDSGMGVGRRRRRRPLDDDDRCSGQRPPPFFEPSADLNHVARRASYTTATVHVYDRCLLFRISAIQRRHSVAPTTSSSGTRPSCRGTVRPHLYVGTLGGDGHVEVVFAWEMVHHTFVTRCSRGMENMFCLDASTCPSTNRHPSTNRVATRMYRRQGHGTCAYIDVPVLAPRPSTRTSAGACVDDEGA